MMWFSWATWSVIADLCCSVVDAFLFALVKHYIHAAVRPTNTLKSILVHPKDKKDITETSDVVYDVPCGGCDKSYVGETGRQFGTRLQEHQKDVTTVADVKFTRANRKASTTEQHKSAITDHVAQENHIIKWDEAKILDRDSNTFSRRIREAIEIRKKGAKAINRDEGSFTLDHVYDSLLCTTSHPRKENNNKFPGKSSEPRHLWSSHQPRWRKLKFVSIYFWICQT